MLGLIDRHWADITYNIDIPWLCHNCNNLAGKHAVGCSIACYGMMRPWLLHHHPHWKATVTENRQVRPNPGLSTFYIFVLHRFTDIVASVQHYIYTMYSLLFCEPEADILLKDRIIICFCIATI